MNCFRFVRTVIALYFSIFAIAALGQGFSPKIDKDVQTLLQAGKNADALVLFSERPKLDAARFLRGKEAKARFVFNQLQALAARTQGRALELVRQHDGAANSLFLVNALALDQASPALIEALAALPEVRAIAADPWVKFPESLVESQELVSARSGIEWGIERINAPVLWNTGLFGDGFNGQGITIGGADTGFDWTHPALSKQYRGSKNDGSVDHNYNWHDAIKAPSPLNSDSLNPCGFNTKEPCDDGIHGTHTMGTMVGDDGNGNQIGVAPGARWIGCRNMERGWGQPSTYIDCFQWFLAPTDLNGANPDPTKAPHVINNSWYCADIEGCNSLAVNELMRDAIIALKAAGVFVVVANGNFGPNCTTTNIPPAYFKESFSIGATRSDDTIASFSSRGPIVIDGSFRVKPDVCAPGQSIRSCRPDSMYATLGGTSMAAPHVAGLVALILSGYPEGAGEVETIEEIIRQTAAPHADTSHCGIPGEQTPNMAYGFGRVDAHAAALGLYFYLLSAVDDPALSKLNVAVSPNPVKTQALFQIANGAENSTLHLYNSGGTLVLSRRFNAKGQANIRLSMEGLPGGVYVWQLQSGEKSAVGKLVKEQ